MKTKDKGKYSKQTDKKDIRRETKKETEGERESRGQTKFCKVCCKTLKLKIMVNFFFHKTNFFS